MNQGFLDARYRGRVSHADLPAIVPTYVFAPSQRTDQLYTGFVQNEVPLAGNQFTFTFGSRILRSSFTGFNLAPSARFLWAPSTRRSFRAAVTRALRTSSDIEDILTSTSLLSVSPITYSVTTGDGRFTRETMPGYETGYRSLIELEFSQILRYVSALPARQVGSYDIPHAELSLTGQNLPQTRHVEYGGDPGTLVAVNLCAIAAITWRQ